MFDLNEKDLVGRTIWDISGGVASFTAEARKLGGNSYALDPLFCNSTADIRTMANVQLRDFCDSYVSDAFIEKKTGQRAHWLVPHPTETVDSISKLLAARHNSLALFFEDLEKYPDHYVTFSFAGSDETTLNQEEALAHLPRPDLITIGNFLMAYAGKKEFGLQFHIQALVNSYSWLNPGGTIKIYPFGEDGAAFGYNPEANLGFDPADLLKALDQLRIPYKPVLRPYAFVRGWTHGLELYK